MTGVYIPDADKASLTDLVIAHACAHVGALAEIELGTAAATVSPAMLQAAQREILLGLVESVYAYLTSHDLNDPEIAPQIEAMRFSHPETWAMIRDARNELEDRVKLLGEYLRRLRGEGLRLVPTGEEVSNGTAP